MPLATIFVNPLAVTSRQALFSIRVSALVHAGVAAVGLACSLVASPVHLHMRRGTVVWEVSFSAAESLAADAPALVFIPRIIWTRPNLAPSSWRRQTCRSRSPRPSAEALLVRAGLPQVPHELEACDCPAHDQRVATPKSQPAKAAIPETTPQPSALPPRPRAAAEFSVSTAAALPASAAVAGMEVDELPRKMAANPPPPYPNDAYQRRQEGRVLLEVHVSPRGAVEALRVLQSSGVAALDQAALDTVRDWRFEPARRGGQNVAAVVNIPIRFSLAAP